MRMLTLSLMTGLTLACSTVAFNSAAFAEETILTGPNGQQTTIENDVNRSNGTTTVDRTVTYPDGQTSNSTGTFTGNNGQYSGTVNRTNRRGTSNTYQVNGNRSHQNGTWQNTGTVTGPQGNQSTYTNNGACANGQCNDTRTTTFQNGQTRTVNSTGTRTSPGNYSGTSTVTNRRGNTRSLGVQRTR